jgi:hypothetical protein
VRAVHAERATDGRAGLPRIVTVPGHECRAPRYGLPVMRRAVIAGLAVALLAPRAAAACDEFIIESKVFEFSSRGGILMRYHASPTKGPAYEAPLVNKKWKFKLANKRAIPPKVKMIAPGLVVVTLPKGVAAGVLVDGDKRIAELDAIDEDEPRLEEPRVRSVTYTRTEGKPPTKKTEGTPSSTRVTVEIVGPAPRTAVAIVLANEDGDPMTFGMIDPGKPLVAFERKECTLHAEGTIEPEVGMKVKAFWVDQFGRVSPRSELKRIGAEAAPAKDTRE